MVDLGNVPEKLSGSDKNSFAYFTIKDRLPVILTQVIDLLCQDKSEISQKYGEETKEEIKQIIGFLSKLCYEMQTNKTLVAIQSKGPDVEIWNNYLRRETSKLSREPQWFRDDWLYVENYLYRRIKEAFELSDHLKSFDPFCKQKQKALMNSMNAITMMIEHLDHVVTVMDLHREDADFYVFLELSLWANKCDLSISAGAENAWKDSPLSVLQKLRKNILVDDGAKLLKILDKLSKKSNNVCLDLVLDNVGFELVADFCFLEILTVQNLIHKARIYVKVMPWYVSDTTVPDLQWTLKTLGESQNAIVSSFANRWRNRINCGKWQIEEEGFWTLPYDFSEMKTVDQSLYEKLSNADVILFKGDLNYRKLVGDRRWPPTTPFRNSLCGFLPSTLCSLRTLKADVIVGLASGQADALNKAHADWMISGDYGVIQCALKN